MYLQPSWNTYSTLRSFFNRGGSRGRVQGVPPPPPRLRWPAFFLLFALNICLCPVTSQLRHSLVVHPLLKKNPGSAPVYNPSPKATRPFICGVGSTCMEHTSKSYIKDSSSTNILKANWKRGFLNKIFFQVESKFFIGWDRARMHICNKESIDLRFKTPTHNRPASHFKHSLLAMNSNKMNEWILMLIYKVMQNDTPTVLSSVAVALQE